MRVHSELLYLCQDNAQAHVNKYSTAEIQRNRFTEICLTDSPAMKTIEQVNYRFAIIFIFYRINLYGIILKSVSKTQQGGILRMPMSERLLWKNVSIWTVALLMSLPPLCLVHSLLLIQQVAVTSLKYDFRVCIFCCYLQYISHLGKLTRPTGTWH